LLAGKKDMGGKKEEKGTRSPAFLTARHSSSVWGQEKNKLNHLKGQKNSTSGWVRVTLWVQGGSSEGRSTLFPMISRKKVNSWKTKKNCRGGGRDGRTHGKYGYRNQPGSRKGRTGRSVY